MKVKLVCEESSKEKILKELENRGIEVSDEAEFILYQKNYSTNSYIPAQDEKGSISLIKYTDVMYFEAVNKITYSETVNGQYVVKEKLYELEEKLNIHSFLRVSKSHIVNIDFIDKIIPWIGSKYILEMKNSAQIDVTRSYYQSFKKRLGI